MTTAAKSGAWSGSNPASVEAAVRDLERELGAELVSCAEQTLDAMSHDAWPVSVIEQQRGVHAHRPDVVVFASKKEHVVAALRSATRHGLPVTPRGLGSSVTGQPLPTRGGIVLDMGGFVAVPVLDEVNGIVTVGAGMRGSDLEEWLNERGKTANFFPQSLPRSSVGGWIATRATGQLSSRYGGIEDAAVGYTVLLSDGTTVSVGSKPRAAVGPDLRELFLGSEGVLGVVTEVRLRVFDLPELRIHEAYEFPDVQSGLDALRRIYQSGIRPSLMRLYDASEAAHAVAGYLGSGSVLFLTHEGISAIARAEHEASAEQVRRLGGTSRGSEPVQTWYARRFDFSTVEGRLREPGGYAETIEVAHLWSGIGDLYSRLREVLTPLADEVLCHFSHVYTHGTSLYVILLGRTESNDAAADRLREIWQTALEVTTEQGGELSHHHGAGLARQEFIPRALGTQHELIRRLKRALDPQNILNPGHLGLEPHNIKENSENYATI